MLHSYAGDDRLGLLGLLYAWHMRQLQPFLRLRAADPQMLRHRLEHLSNALLLQACRYPQPLVLEAFVDVHLVASCLH